ncbi:hypothetical protein [Nitrosopumilus sp.]|nr:hypothetical protein [Nitrosopumilus sp.]
MDWPISVPEKENRFLGIIFENEKLGKTRVCVNTDCSESVWDIKNSF